MGRFEYWDLNGTISSGKTGEIRHLEGQDG